MSEIKVNSIKGIGASAAAITVNNTDGTCTANITNKPNRNLILNGAFLISQRGTSATHANQGAFNTVDRWKTFLTGSDEAQTYSQSDVASGTTPYTLGFRKAFKITNGNQTSGAGNSDVSSCRYVVEAQDIATSGWNYTDPNSKITLSFWVKSSVAQDFKGYLRSGDGTRQQYPFATGSLSANTWTKVTKTISGNSNLQFDNDTGAGLDINISQYFGTDYSDSGTTENAWTAYASSSRVKDYSSSSWWTTNDSTFEITGVQLEVGSVATDFEHRSFGQELALCQRYYFLLVKDDGSNSLPVMNAATYNSSDAFGVVQFPVQMRTVPTLDAISVTNDFLVYASSGNANAGTITLNKGTNTAAEMKMDSSRGAGNAGFVRTTAGGGGFLAFTAEL